MNHTSSALGLKMMEAHSREAHSREVNGDTCWDTGYHRTQIPMLPMTCYQGWRSNRREGSLLLILGVRSNRLRNRKTKGSLCDSYHRMGKLTVP